MSARNQNHSTGLKFGFGQNTDQSTDQSTGDDTGANSGQILDQDQLNAHVRPVVHDLRNPLNAILGFTEMLKDERFGAHANPRYKEYSELVHEAALKLLAKCNELIDEPNVAPVPQKPQAEDTRSAITQTAMLYQAMAENRGVALNVNIDDDFPQLDLPDTVIEQVLNNLVSNAIKFTPSGGRVTVLAKREDDGRGAILVISDSGVGIEDKTIGQLHRAERVEPGKSPHGDDGSGLGLSIVEQALRPYGVSLEIFRNANNGTSVSLQFPESLNKV